MEEYFWESDKLCVGSYVHAQAVPAGDLQGRHRCLLMPPPILTLLALHLPTDTLGSSIAVVVSQGSSTAGKAGPEHLIKSLLPVNVFSSCHLSTHCKPFPIT